MVEISGFGAYWVSGFLAMLLQTQGGSSSKMLFLGSAYLVIFAGLLIYISIMIRRQNRLIKEQERLRQEFAKIDKQSSV